MCGPPGSHSHYYINGFAEWVCEWSTAPQSNLTLTFFVSLIFCALILQRKPEPCFYLKSLRNMLFSLLLADTHCLSLQRKMIMITWLLLFSLFRQSTQDGQGEGKYVVLYDSLQVWKGSDIFSKEDFRFQLLVVHTPEFAQIIFTMYAKSQRQAVELQVMLTLHSPEFSGSISHWDAESRHK